MPTARLPRLAVAVLSGLLLLGAPAHVGLADDSGSPIVFPAGQERRLLEAVSPLKLSTPVADGWSLDGLEVGRSTVRYVLRRGDDAAGLTVALDGTVRSDGAPAYAMTPDGAAPAATKALQDAFEANATVEFWESVVQIPRDQVEMAGPALGPRGTQRWQWRLAALASALALLLAAGTAWRRRSAR